MKTPCGHDWQKYIGTGKGNIYQCSVCEKEAVHFKHCFRDEQLVDIDQVSHLLELYSQALEASSDCINMENDGCLATWDVYKYHQSNLDKFLGIN